jgi:hypothetical protein
LIIAYPPRPTTCRLKPPSINVDGLAAAATLDDAKGKPHAGVLL